MQIVIMAILLVVGMASSAFFYKEGRAHGWEARDAQYAAAVRDANERIDAMDKQRQFELARADADRKQAVSDAVASVPPKVVEVEVPANCPKPDIVKLCALPAAAIERLNRIR